MFTYLHAYYVLTACLPARVYLLISFGRKYRLTSCQARTSVITMRLVSIVKKKKKNRITEYYEFICSRVHLHVFTYS